MHPAGSILITLGILATILTLAAWGCRRNKLSPESARKSVHIGMGLLCLSFPWLFDSVLAVQSLAGIAVVSLLFVRMSQLRHSLGSALFSIERLSVGELLFPAAVAWLFTLGWDQPILYAISLLLLTLADSASALTGSIIGKNTYQTSGASKSLEGSLAFFLTALLCTALPLHFCSELPWEKLVLLSLTVALFTTAVEGASGHGSDNLLIPIGSFLLLDYYMGLSGQQLLIRSCALIALLAILLTTRRKHTLNGGALLTALLYSFATFTLGGIPCLLATLNLFVRHMLVQNRLSPEDVHVHSIGVVLAISIPSLTWLTLGRGQVLGHPDAQFGFISTLAMVIYMLNTGTQKHLLHARPAMTSGFLLMLVTLLPSLWLQPPWLHYLPTLLISPALALLYFYWRQASRKPEPSHWLKLSLLALVGSSANIAIIQTCLS